MAARRGPPRTACPCRRWLQADHVRIQGLFRPDSSGDSLTDPRERVAAPQGLAADRAGAVAHESDRRPVLP